MNVKDRSGLWVERWWLKAGRNFSVVSAKSNFFKELNKT